MHFIYDNLAASIMTMTVLTILIVVQTRAQEAAIDATRYYAGKKTALVLVEMIDRDFRSMRADKVNGPVIHQKKNGLLEFDTQEMNGPIRRIKYEWAIADTMVSKKNGTESITPLYLVKRFEQKSGAWVASGSSAQSIVSFEVNYLDGKGAAVSDTKSVHQISVRFVNASPLGRGKVVDYTNWQATYRPVRVAGS